jgi:hypothetical protein
VNLPPVAYIFQQGDPAGWVHATTRHDGLRMELRCVDNTHKDHGQVVDLKWRRGVKAGWPVMNRQSYYSASLKRAFELSRGREAFSLLVRAASTMNPVAAFLPLP